MTRCAGCGVVGALGFQRVRGGRHLCPPCVGARRRKRRGHRWILDALLVLLVLAFGSGSDLFEMEAGFLAVGIVGIVAHELGHALVGAALGFRVLTISIGAGPRVAQVRRRQWSFELHLFPVGGYVCHASPFRRAYRLRHWLSVLAGPLANLVVGWCALVVLPQLGASAALTWWAAFGQVIVAVTNLVPLRVATTLGMQPSDGRQLLDIPKLTDAEIDQRVAGFADAVAHEDARRADHEPEAVLRATAGALDTEVVGNAAAQHALALAQSGRVEEALALARHLLATKPADPIARANLLNCIGWWIAMLDLRPAEAEAEAASAEALAQAPWSAAFQSTRGAVLAWRGVDLLPAIALLEGANRGLLAPEYRRQPSIKQVIAHDHAFIALAHARRGDLYSARVSLLAARRGDPSFPVLAQVERVLKEAGVEPFPTDWGAVATRT